MAERLGVFAFVVLGLAFMLWLMPGCGLGDEDSDGGGDYDQSDLDAYLDALPDQESLTLTVPEDEDGNAKAMGGLGGLAVFYDMTVDLTRDVNEHVLMFLSWIDEIVSYRPTSHEGETYTWGPYVSRGLSPVEQQFTMTRVGDRAYDYFLMWRPRESTTDWQAVWTGHAEAHTGTARRGTGSFAVDFTVAREMDPTIDEQGRIETVYDTVSDGREIDVQYSDFYGDDAQVPLNGLYQYHNHADNTGEFVFDYWMDIHFSEWTGSEFTGDEHVYFLTRWLQSGAGRTDVVAKDGDLPDIEMAGSTVDRFEMSECWADDFLRGFYEETVFLGNGEHYQNSEGDEGVCVFEPLMPSID